MDNFGIVYAVTGEKNLREAVTSAESVKKFHPDVPIALLSEVEFADPVFDHVKVLETVEVSRRIKMHLEETPFEAAMYLDSDIRVIGDLSEAFELLTRFEFAANQVSSGYHYKLDGVPDSFPEYNSGVMLFRNTEKFAELMRRWRSTYIEFHNEDGNPWDQKSLRKVLWESDLQLGWLRGEYNFMPYSPAIAMTNVYLLHGRPDKAINWMEEEVNRRDGPRAFLPDIGIIHGSTSVTFLELFRHVIRTKLFILKKLSRKLRGLG
jgi:hypothetical protein